MEEFICMLSSTSADDQTTRKQIVSTWQVATLTSRYLREGLGLATTMRSKMATSLQEVSNDQKKKQKKRSHHETLRERLLSDLRSLQRSFGKTALHLHQTNLFGATIPQRLTTTLHTRWRKMHTKHHKGWDSALTHTRNLLSGLESGWSAIREEVGYLARRIGASPRRSAPLRYKRKGTPAPCLGAPISELCLGCVGLVIHSADTVLLTQYVVDPSYYGVPPDWEKPIGQDHLENMSTMGATSCSQTLEMTLSMPSSMTWED